MTGLGGSPPPVCVCGHRFHVGRCQWRREAFVDNRGWYGLVEHLHDAVEQLRLLFDPYECACPDGELDGDR